MLQARYNAARRRPSCIFKRAVLLCSRYRPHHLDRPLDDRSPPSPTSVSLPAILPVSPFLRFFFFLPTRVSLFPLSPFLSFSLSHATPLSVHKTRILSSTLYVFASIFFLRGLRPLFLLFPRLRTSRFVFCTLRRDKEFLRRIRPVSLNVFTLRHPSLTKQPRSIAGIQGYFPNFDKYSEVSAN